MTSGLQASGGSSHRLITLMPQTDKNCGAKIFYATIKNSLSIQNLLAMQIFVCLLLAGLMLGRGCLARQGLEYDYVTHLPFLSGYDRSTRPPSAQLQLLYPNFIPILSSSTPAFGHLIRNGVGLYTRKFWTIAFLSV